MMNNLHRKNSIFFLLRVLSGPVLYFVLQQISIAHLPEGGSVVLGLYAWIVCWWIFKPIPWGITAFLPLIVIPVSGFMNISAVSALYGQRLLFFLIGVLSFGLAVQKHGLGKRIALSFLSIGWISRSTNRILLTYLIVIAVMSAFVDDAATVAIGIPIGISIVQYASRIKSGAVQSTEQTKKFQNFMMIGVLYAAEAGGIMSVAGIPHIAISLSILEKLTGRSITFLQWSEVGVMIGVVSFVLFFLLLRIFFKPEFSVIPDSHSFFCSEKQRLGAFSRGEKNVVFVFVVMIVLWVMPSFIHLDFLDIWIVPVIASILLYLLPSEKASDRRTLELHDFQQGLPWNIVFLILCGGVMASVSLQSGVIDWMSGMIPADLGRWPLMLLSGFGTATVSNFISGTATVNLMGNLLFPLSLKIGLNPLILAYVLPTTGMAVMFPWAGAASGIAFSSGKVDMRQMIRCGFFATCLNVLVAVCLSNFLVPLLFG